MSQPRKRFTEDQKKQALLLGASIGRNGAVRELGISKSTFHRWTEQFPRVWSDAIAKRDTEFQKQIASQFEDLAENYTEAEQAAISAALEQIQTGDLDAKELAALIKAMGSSRGLASVNARQARGEPDKSIDINVNFPALEAAAEAILDRAPPPPAIESTAVEVESG